MLEIVQLRRGRTDIQTLLCLIPTQPTFYGWSLAYHFHTYELEFPLLLKLRSARLCFKKKKNNLLIR